MEINNGKVETIRENSVIGFKEVFHNSNIILMEGALAERLKREYNIEMDKDVDLAGHIYNEEHRKILKDLYIQYINISKKYNFPIMIATPTRRANKDRVSNSKYNKNIIKDNVSFLKGIKKELNSEIYIGGLMGCKGDAYKSNEGLTEDESYKFNLWQVTLFKESNVDYLYASIMPTLSEAIGMAKAMDNSGLPYIISFMIRNNGKLLDGTTINDAIEAIDAATNNNPICYMSNCVHPDIVYEALAKAFNQTEIVKKRFKGIQANTANLSPEEIENSLEIISSDGNSLANSMLRLKKDFKFKIFGGCCGTNEKYMNEIAKILNR